jgi:hypothetical protein
MRAVKHQRRKDSGGSATAARSKMRRQRDGPRRENWASCLLLAVVVLATYSAVRDYPFINYDDPTYVTENPHVQAGLSGDTIRWAFTATAADNWHPLTWFSHALDCQLFGLDAGWHHITSLLLHVLNVILLFLLLVKVTGAAGRSFMVAGLFGLHPFNVDSVAWIAERKNVLSTLFLLLTLAAYGWYALKPGVKRYLLVAALFAMGLAAKPMLVTLPFAMLLLDYWPLRRVAGWSEPAEQFPAGQTSALRLLLEKLPLLALSVASAIVTVVVQTNSETLPIILPYPDRIANAIFSYTVYIWKTFFPTRFAVFYPHPFAADLAVPPSPFIWAVVVVGLLFLITVSLAAWWQRRTRPYLITGWLWFLGTLVPVIGIIQVGDQGMADRYAYVPLMGIFVIVAFGGAEIVEHLGVPLPGRRALAAAVLITLAVLTFRQVGYWDTSLDLWTHTLEVTRNNYYAHDVIGDLLTNDQEVLQHYQAAVKIAPRDIRSRLSLAEYFQDHEQFKEAIQNYADIVHTTLPDQHLRGKIAFAYVNLCIIFGELGDSGRSHEAFERAKRNDAQAVETTIHNMKQVIALRPSDRAFLGLGLLLEQAGQPADARDAYTEALKLNPNQPQAQRGLARLEGGRAQGDPNGG